MKLIAPPEGTIKKTKLDELLVQLRNNLTGCLAACETIANHEDFQAECWRILIQLEKETKKLNEYYRTTD